MNNIKISVIIPVYNPEKYLSQCIESVIYQKFDSVEIICVNDGSKDNSLSILNQYAENDKRFIIINIPNGGVSNARNTGLKYANGEYVIFLDSDDWLDGNFCEQLYNVAQKENADIVMCSYCREYQNKTLISHALESDYIVYDKVEVQKNIHRRLYGLIDDELAYPEKGDSIVSPCMQLFKKDIAKMAEFVDIREIGTFEDGLYQIDVYQHCDRFVYIDEPLYHYRKTNEQSITTKYKEDLFIRWGRLYDLMEERIAQNGYGEEYRQALNNRICFSMLGLGFNELADKNKNIFKKSKILKEILKTERYKQAFKQLKIKKMPLKWKGFFVLCKNRMTFLLVLLLKIMDKLRGKI